MGLDKTVGEGKKRWILSIRTTAEGRERLVKAADDNGRSLSEEIETRLQLSFQRDDAYGGFVNAAFVNLLGSLIRDAEAETGKGCRADPATLRVVRHRILQALDERVPTKGKSRSRGSNVSRG
jgi:hypothetical protein